MYNNDETRFIFITNSGGTVYDYDTYYKTIREPTTNINSNENNIPLLLTLTFGTIFLLYKKQVLNFLFTKDICNIKPLRCSFTNIFNYNNESDNEESDNEESDNEKSENEELDNKKSDNEELDNNSNELEITEIETDNDSESDVEDIENSSKHIFLTTNYDEVMTECNNPFYKKDKIKYYLSLQKKDDLITSKFVEDNNSSEVIISDKDEDSLINVTKLSDSNIIEEEKTLEDSNLLEYKFLETEDVKELHVSHNEPNVDKRIWLPHTWSINSENEEYINFEIEEDNIDHFFGNLLGVILCYYGEFHSKYQNLNIIYNENSESPVLLNQSNISFKDSEYITYNLLNIRDLYAYKNQEQKMLDYEKVNFNNKELREYYNESIDNLTEKDLKSLYKQI